MASITYAAATHEGNVRDHNEDAYVADEDIGLWLIADGMGGHAGGEIASAIASDVIRSGIEQGMELRDAIQKAHQSILDAVKNGEGKYGMGTTVVAVHMSDDRRYEIAWAGDSRAYLWDDGLRQITKDHSYVQMLIDLGKILPEEARWHPQKNIITQNLGSEFIDTVMADVLQDELKPGQRLLLCSDGLNDELDDRTIKDIMEAGGDDQTIVDTLMNTVLAGNARDNVTVVVISAS